MTRAASEPHRRHVGGVTWTRNELGQYHAKVGEALYELLPVRSGRSGPVSYDLVVDGKFVGGSWPIPNLTKSLQRASILVRRERNALDPIPPPDAPTYPEHEKLKRIVDQSEKLGEFIEWLEGQGIFFATADPREDRLGGHVLITESTTQLLARYFQIDLNVIEREKRAMLDALREKRAMLDALRAKAKETSS